MKKMPKRIFTGLGIALIVIVLFFLGYFLVARSITKGMSPVVTGETVKNIYSIKDSFVNLFLVKDGENFIAIDAGNNTKHIEQELKKLNIDPDKVRAILLTHTDGDHVAGIRLFKNSDVYLSSQEEQMINGKKSRFFIFGNGIDTNKPKLLENKQILKIGETKIQCFLVPGHTPGSMCYLVNDSLLFTGDALRLNKGNVEKFYSFFNMDSETASHSIDSIIRISGVRYLFTAHNGFTGNFKSAFTDWSLKN